jgi:hypothetical protein
MYGLYHNDVVHYLSLNAQNQPLHYEIINHPTGLKPDVHWVDFQGPIQIVPSAFVDSTIPGFDPCTKKPLTTSLCMAFQPKLDQQPLKTPSAAHHLVEGIFNIGKGYANHKECVSLLWFHDQTAIVFAFRHGELLFANSFPSSNIQEHLYYALLPFHEEKLTPQQLGLFVFCDKPQQGATAQLFQKFIPHAEILSPQFPWMRHEPIPFQHIVSPLIKLSACVSPADN